MVQQTTKKPTKTASKTTTSKANNDSEEERLLTDLTDFRETGKAWNETFNFVKPIELDIVKSQDSKDKDGNIIKFGKLMIRIKFEGQRKGFFISKEVIADKLIDFIIEKKDLILKLSQYVDLVNEVSDVVKENNKEKPKEYKIL